MSGISVSIAGLFGLFIGSFLHVIYFRFGHWKEIAVSRSHCPHCHTVLQASDLIPLFSFIVLQGKCRYCKKPISWQYPLTELLTGITTAAIWWQVMPHNLQTVIYALGLLFFAYSMLIMMLQDDAEMLVSDSLFASALLAGAFVAIASGRSLESSLFGIAAAAGPLLLLVLISKEQWMGWGDVFLAVSTGLVLGFPLSLFWLYASFVLGAAWGIIELTLGKKSRKDPVPFIPILFAAFLLTYLLGDQLVQWYVNWMSAI